MYKYVYLETSNTIFYENASHETQCTILLPKEFLFALSLLKLVFFLILVGQYVLIIFII